MTLSFRWRLTIRWLLAFGAILALADAAIYVGARRFLLHDFEAQLRTLAATELASAIDEPDHKVHLHEFLPAVGPYDHADKFVQLIGADGRLLLESEGLRNASPFVSGEVLASALAGRSPIIDVTHDGRHGRMIALVTDPPDHFVVAVGLFTEELDATLRRLRELLAAVWVATLGLTALLGFTLASRALAPIRQITERAGTIADGQFATRLDRPLVDDEIGRMTTLLNQMLDRLHGALEANRRFAGDASHELRGPLTAMLGEIDVTLKRDRTGDDYRRSLRLLREQLQVMTALTQDLMLLVRAQESLPPTIAEVALDQAVARVMERNAPWAAAAGVRLRREIPIGLMIYGDASLFDRLFENLVRNAIQYNIEGGTVDVTARLEPSGAPHLADRVVIGVMNTGASIPAAERERVFERFYRVDPSRSRRTGGTGLGLAISREIVRLFQGEIRVLDADDATSIEVVLPGTNAAAELGLSHA